MKEQRHTLGNKLFFEALGRLNDVLYNQEIDYVLVGGTAVQVIIANLSSERTGQPINEIPALESLLRPTDDFDIACSGSEMDYVLAMNTLTTDPSIEEVRHKSNRKTTTIKIRGGKGRRESAVININYELNPEDFKGLPESYQDIIDSACFIELRNGTKTINVNVAAPEYIVASKLTRGSEKDRIDITNLLTAMSDNNVTFSYERVQEILEKSGRQECYSALLTC